MYQGRLHPVFILKLLKDSLPRKQSLFPPLNEFFVLCLTNPSFWCAFWLRYWNLREFEVYSCNCLKHQITLLRPLNLILTVPHLHLSLSPPTTIQTIADTFVQDYGVWLLVDATAPSHGEMWMTHWNNRKTSYNSFISGLSALATVPTHNLCNSFCNENTNPKEETDYRFSSQFTNPLRRVKFEACAHTR